MATIRSADAAESTAIAISPPAGATETDSRLLPTLRPAQWLPARSDISSAGRDHNGATAVLDYLDDTTALQFARTFDPALSQLANGLGAGWRHTYDVMLTMQNDRRVIHDSLGKHLLFRQTSADNPDVLLADDRADGELRVKGKGHEWSLPSGWRYRFQGSYLVSVTHVQQPYRLSLYYANGQLAQVTDERGNHLQFSYEARQLHKVTTPSGTVEFDPGSDGSLDGITIDREARIAYAYRDAAGTSDARRTFGACVAVNEPDKTPEEDTADEPEDSTAGSDVILEAEDQQDASPQDTLLEPDEPQVCNTENSPPPEGFLAPSLDPLVIRVDARPGSCQSYFIDYEGIDRGQAIENGFEDHERYESFEATVNSFPVVDFITDGEWLIVISRDLTSASYNDPSNSDALYDTLMRDGQTVQNQLLNPLQAQGFIEVTENGQTTRLTVDETGNPVLEMVIQYGMATPAQREQIRRAADDLAELYGIELRVIEIP